MNWSFLAAFVGDMCNGEELKRVLVRLPSGEVVEAATVARVNGELCILLSGDEE